MFSTPPWRRYSNAWATTPAGAVEASVSAGSGSASPPKAEQRHAGGGAAGAQGVEALGPGTAAAQQPHQHHAGPGQHLVEQRARGPRRAVGLAQRTAPKSAGRRSTARGGGQHLGVRGGQEDDHAGAPVRTVGSSDGGPFSISSSRASVSACSSTRSPSTSSRRSRTSANGTAPGVKSRPRASRHPGEHRAAQRVALEHAVPRGTEHRPDAAALGGAVARSRTAPHRRRRAPGPWWIS